MRKGKGVFKFKMNLKALLPFLRSKMQEMIWFGGRMKCKNVNNYMKEKQKRFS